MEMAKTFDEISGDVSKALRNFPDFPQAGILFKDIMPILKNPKLTADLCLAIAKNYSNEGITAVAGCEARGFLFGVQVAIHLNVPFVPIRKKGKLPGKCVSASYLKEYGEDIVEVQEDAFQKGDKVLIIDDLLATGGTMNAAIQVIEKAGAFPTVAFCIIELVDLKGKNVLPKSTRFESMLKF
uniref:Adenine phosphoribosyltransferase n=1 Tax=Rhabditophanes sp. KR3021 TaxID=114890 RepID=A0AC35TUI5_9BILA